jgi:phytanoyl-CoA hydroxylase
LQLLPYDQKTQTGYTSASASAIDDHAAGFFLKNGYLVVTSAANDGEIQSLVDETTAICRGKLGDFRKASSKGRNPSGATVAEQPDFASFEGRNDEAVLREFLCVHQISPEMLRFLAHPVIVDVLTRVIGPNVKCMQSMLFLKAAGKPGQAWHQDEDYIPTRDRSLCGAWIAMDDATVENGCLWVIPGSHRSGVRWPMFPHNDGRFDYATEAFGFPYSDSDAVPVEVPRGSIVFFNGYLLHRSLPNRAKNGFRRALVNHYMSAESLLPWRNVEGIGMAKCDYRDVVMIAGEDPYYWKDHEDIAKPHIRPDAEGGCGDGRYELDDFKRQGMPVKRFL